MQPSIWSILRKPRLKWKLNLLKIKAKQNICVIKIQHTVHTLGSEIIQSNIACNVHIVRAWRPFRGQQADVTNTLINIQQNKEVISFYSIEIWISATREPQHACPVSHCSVFFGIVSGKICLSLLCHFCCHSPTHHRRHPLFSELWTDTKDWCIVISLCFFSDITCIYNVKTNSGRTFHPVQ